MEWYRSSEEVSKETGLSIFIDTISQVLTVITGKKIKIKGKQTILDIIKEGLMQKDEEGT